MINFIYNSQKSKIKQYVKLYQNIFYIRKLKDILIDPQNILYYYYVKSKIARSIDFESSFNEF